MSIAFCINDAYTDKVGVVMTSILENHPCNFIAFYIFSSDLSDVSLEKLNKLHTKYQNFSLKRILVTSAEINSLKINIPYISTETYYRYIIADLLPNIGKILYLDADLVVCKSINNFYNINLGNNYLAGVEDMLIKKIGHKGLIGLKQNDCYINAGVLLMNLGLIRQNKLGQILINKTIELYGKTKFQDQDIINIVCQGRIKTVDSIYNFASSNIRKEIGKRKKACVIHFTGELKPWHKRGIDWRHIWQFWHWRKNMKLFHVWQRYQRIYQKITSYSPASGRL